MDKALYRIKLRLRAELDSFFGGRRMERWIYWIKKAGKDCKGFCVFCKYYNQCKEDTFLDLGSKSLNFGNFRNN